MKLPRRISLVGISLMLAVATIACGKKDEPANVNRGPDDAAITSNVRTKLASDIPGTTINVDTREGVVTLSGDVRSPADKTKAEQSARTVSGVKSVTNNIRFEPSEDDKLKQAVDANLTKYGVTGITAEVRDGVITLKGDIQRAKLQDAMKAANEAQPKQVKNEMNIR